MNENSSPTEIVIKAPDRERLALAPEAREQWLKRFWESGLSIRKFSATHNLPRMTLWRWVKSARPVPAKVGHLSTIEFAELKLPVGPDRSDWVAELSLADGTVLRLSREVPAGMLEQLLRVC
jgi:hypothetical protein